MQVRRRYKQRHIRAYATERRNRHNNITKLIKANITKKEEDSHTQ